MRLSHLLFAAVIACFVFLIGCDDPKSSNGGGGSNSGAGNAKTGRLLGVSFQTMRNPFFPKLESGIKATVEAKGDRLVTLDAQYRSDKQANDISDLIQQGASVIFINPVNWAGIRGSLIKAQAKNIPCIIIDAPVEDQSLVLSTVASDNVEAGRLAARALAAARPNAKLVILHLAINKACIDRVAGFKEEMAKTKMTLLDTQEGKGTIEGGQPIMRDLLGRFPDLDAVFAINDPSALGAISALESAGKLSKVTVVAVDGSDDAVAAIKAGKLLASSAQFPVEIGKQAAAQAYNHLEGKPVTKDVKVKVELVDKKNVDSFNK